MSEYFIFRSFDNFKTQTYAQQRHSGRLTTLKFSQCLTPKLPHVSSERKGKSSLQLHSPKPSLMDSPSSTYFPDWLLRRNDFKKILDPKSEEMDIGKICEEDNKVRDDLQKKELLEWCQSCVFFQSFSQYTCKEVCARLFTRRFKPGEIVIKEGDVGDCMFIIVKGRVEISKAGKYLDSMGAKNVFGEAALESNYHRSATVSAISDLTTLVLNKEDYYKIISRQKHMLRSDIVSLIRKIPIFQDMMLAKLERMAWRMLIMNYSQGHVIYSQDQSPTGLYFIKEGSVHLIFDVTITMKGKIPGNLNVDIGNKSCQLHIKTISKGDFFGEEELIEGISRKTKAICAENSVILFMKEKKFRKTFNEREKEIISSAHEKMKSVKMMARECINNYIQERIKQKAFSQVTGDSFSNQIDRSSRRKELAAKSLQIRYSTQDLKEKIRNSKKTSTILTNDEF
jgi:CRP-like cAMP-binding protein